MSLSTLGSSAFVTADRRPRFRVVHVLSITGLFWVFAQILAWVGEPRSPAWKALERMKEPIDVAIVGDSRAHVGLSPARLAASLESAGVSPVVVHNFAVDGTDALHHASFVIQGLLQRNPPPGVIIWATNPLGFNEERSSNRLEQLTLSDLPLLWKSKAPLETLLDIGTAEGFSPYRQRAAFKRALEGITDSLAWLPVHVQTRVLNLEYRPLQQSRETLHLESGYAPFEIIRWQDAFVRGVAEYERRYRTARLSALHLNVATELLRAAKRSGTCVVIVELPVAPWFLENLAGSEFHMKWRRSMEMLAAEEGAFFLQHAQRGCRDEDFGDPGHMNHQSSVAYSGWLGSELGKISSVVEGLRKGGRFKTDPVAE